MHAVATERSIRLASGLILFAYAACHFLTHATGLFLIEAMERTRAILMAPWHSWPGLVILFGAMAVHGGLGVKAFWRRRHLRIPPLEAWQLALGLSIPVLLIPHAVNVRLGHAVYGLDDSYYRILYQYWITNWARGLPRQLALLLAVWVHGCLGLHMWLRTRPSYPKYSAYLLAAAILIPVLAIFGIMSAGWNIAFRAENEPGFAVAHGPPPRGSPEALASAILANIWWLLQIAYVALLAFIFTMRLSRDWYARSLNSIDIIYPSERTIKIPRGFSILEASRWANIPHAAICGGRGRCTTCRVRVLKGAENLPPPGPVELGTLRKIRAPEFVRLACQTRPYGPVTVARLVHPDMPLPQCLRIAFGEGKELLVTALFIDLRNSTRLAAGRLPYDALFIVDRYVQVVTGVIQSHGGYITHVAGDGIMSVFGTDGDARTGARSALASTVELCNSIEVLSRGFEDELGMTLNAGMGLHSGLSVVGELVLSGNPSIQFLGETGNIAARLEEATKAYSCTAIASEAVFATAGIENAAAFGSRQHIEIRGQEENIPSILISDRKCFEAFCRTELLTRPAQPGSS